MEERRITERPPKEVEDPSQDVERTVAVELSRLPSASGSSSRSARPHARHLRGRVLLAARVERVRQDHDAAHDRRVRRTDRGRYLRRRGPDAGVPLQEAGQHRLPVLRHLPSPQRLRQRGLRAASGRRKGEEIRKRVTDACEMVQLSGFEKRKPHSSPAASSRGSRSRGRSTGRRCCPRRAAGALDLKLSKEMQLYLKNCSTRLGSPSSTSPTTRKRRSP